MTKIVVTGVNGFVGKAVAKELCKSSIKVIGIGREQKIADELKSEDISYYSKDLVDGWPAEIPKNIKSIINLAGLAAVGPSFDKPDSYISTNSKILTNICEYYLGQYEKPRIIVVSTGSCYSSNQDMPLKESCELLMSSPYVVSKMVNEIQARYYINRGLDCVVARPFNHIGVGQSTGFLVPDLIGKIQKNKGANRSIHVGNLKTKRDYTDVRDVAIAYRLLATEARLNKATYNICSGKNISGEEILTILKKIMNINNLRIKVDPKKIRPNDPLNIVGSSKNLYEDTGWRPTIPLEQTLRDVVSLV